MEEKSPNNLSNRYSSPVMVGSRETARSPILMGLRRETGRRMNNLKSTAHMIVVHLLLLKTKVLKEAAGSSRNKEGREGGGGHTLPACERQRGRRQAHTPTSISEEVCFIRISFGGI